MKKFLIKPLKKLLNVKKWSLITKFNEMTFENKLKRLSFIAYLTL